MSRPAFARAAFAFYRYPLYAYGYAYKYGTTLVSSLSIGTGISTSNQVNTTFDYTYNSLGYITNVKKNGTTIASYSYDSLGQMISESNAATGEIYIYTYDKAGNITKKDIYVGDIGNLTDTITYTYGNTVWKDRLTNYDGTAITYDSIGNPTKWGDAIALNWDGRNLVKTVFASNNYINYTYNSDGIRTRKYEYNGAGQYYNNHTYVLDGSTIVKETIAHSSAASGNSTTMLEYYYDESGVSSFRYNGTLYYYVKNLQGDVIGIMDNSGVIVVEYTYDAWGNILSVTGSMASTLGQVNPFRYRGYYYDTETGLYYLNSRYYDAEVGRFISADTYVSTGQGILGSNVFAYCLNNPVSRIDTLGTDSVSVVWNEDRNPLDDLYFSNGGAAIGGNSISLSPGTPATLKITVTKVVVATGVAIITTVAVEKLSTRNHTVYALIDANNTVQYVGRTIDVDKRKAAHENHPLRKSLNFVVLADGLTYLEARAYEQAAMLYHHTINTDNKMNNQINSISPKYWEPFQLIALGALRYYDNRMSNEILYWTENFR